MTPQDRPFISVVIPTMNSGGLIVDCINSVKHCEYPTFEIVVVDGKSKDNTAQLAKVCGADVIMGNGTGRGGDLNIGISHAKGELIAITDDDCIVDRMWLERISQSLSDSEVGFTGGPNIPLLGEGTKTERVGAHIHDFVRLLASKSKEDAVIGCNSAYRKDVLQEIGGFNETIAGAEDTELQSRILAAGYKVVYNPACVVSHRRKESLVKLLRQFWLYGEWMGALHRTNRSRMRQRSRQVYLSSVLLLMSTVLIVSSFFSVVVAEVTIALILAYFVSLLLVHRYMVTKTRYHSNAILFALLSTTCLVLYLTAFFSQEIHPASIEERTAKHTLEWNRYRPVNDRHP